MVKLSVDKPPYHGQHVEDMTTNYALFHRRQIMMMFQFHSWKRRHEINTHKFKTENSTKGVTKFTIKMPKLLEARC